MANFQDLFCAPEKWYTCLFPFVPLVAWNLCMLGLGEHQTSDLTLYVYIEHSNLSLNFAAIVSFTCPLASLHLYQDCFQFFDI